MSEELRQLREQVIRHRESMREHTDPHVLLALLNDIQRIERRILEREKQLGIDPSR